MNRDMFWHKLKLASPILWFTVIYLFFFRYLEQIRTVRSYQITSGLDKYIPFCEYFVVPYILWFALVPAVCIFLLLANESLFVRVRNMLMAGMAVFIILSAVIPNYISLRPAVMPNDNIFCRLTEFIYSADTPTNVFPSIHVYNTLVCMQGIIMAKAYMTKHPAIRNGVLILGILIILSTMLLKQHSVVDVTGAFIMFATFDMIAKPAEVPDTYRRKTAYDQYRS